MRGKRRARLLPSTHPKPMASGKLKKKPNCRVGSRSSPPDERKNVGWVKQSATHQYLLNQHLKRTVKMGFLRSLWMGKP